MWSRRAGKWAMARRRKAILAAFAAGVVSLFVSVPLSVIIAERRALSDSRLENADELSFRASFFDVSLLPAFVIAAAIFAGMFVWMQRRKVSE